MHWVETTGRSVEEATEEALDKLGVDEADAEIEILSEPKTGLFGRLRSEARVRARVRPTAPRAKEDRRERRRRNRSDSKGKSSRAGTTNGNRGTGADSASGDEQKAEAVNSKSGSPSATSGKEAAGSGSSNNRSRNRNRKRGSGGGTQNATTPKSQTPAATNAGSQGSAPREDSVLRDDSGPRTRTGTDGSKEQVTPSAPGDGRAAASKRSQSVRDSRHSEYDPQNPEGEETEVEVSLEEQGRAARQFLEGLLAEFGIEAQIDLSQVDEDTLEMNVHGDDLGILIGPKGATLLALQDLTRTAVHHQTKAGNGRIHLDVSGYRHKRAEALARFAQEIAKNAIESGKRIAMEPMPAADRKVVHDTLTGVDGVSTISEGEDPRRRVVVVPSGEQP